MIYFYCHALQNRISTNVFFHKITNMQAIFLVIFRSMETSKVLLFCFQIFRFVWKLWLEQHNKSCLTKHLTYISLNHWAFQMKTKVNKLSSIGYITVKIRYFYVYCFKFQKSTCVTQFFLLKNQNILQNFLEEQHSVC